MDLTSSNVPLRRWGPGVWPLYRVGDLLRTQTAGVEVTDSEFLCYRMLQGKIHYIKSILKLSAEGSKGDVLCLLLFQELSFRGIR